MTISRGRWLVKKTARRSVAMMPGRHVPGVRALTYHMFGDASRDPFTLGLGDFRTQMAWLSDQDRVIDPHRLSEVIGSRARRAGGLVITIDDGHESVLHAADVLEQFGLSAIIFVVASWVDRPGFLSAGDLRTLSKRGFMIGSHSLEHVLIAPLDPEEQVRQATVSREILSQIVEEPIAAFAYPYGTRAAFNETSASALARAGYRWGFTSQHGAIQMSSAPLALPRVKVEAGDSESTFRSLCQGGLDRWSLVDRLAHRLQAPPAA